MRGGVPLEGLLRGLRPRPPYGAGSQERAEPREETPARRCPTNVALLSGGSPFRGLLRASVAVATRRRFLLERHLRDFRPRPPYGADSQERAAAGVRGLATEFLPSSGGRAGKQEPCGQPVVTGAGGEQDSEVAK